MQPSNVLNQDELFDNIMRLQISQIERDIDLSRDRNMIEAERLGLPLLLPERAGQTDTVMHFE